MEYSALGRTGLKVSRLALGGAAHGDPSLPEDRVERVLNRALDLGVNFIDTAALYSLSEERTGRYLGHRKDEFAIATKCGAYWVVWELTEEPAGDFHGRPWQRARQLPLETVAGELPMVEFALRFALSHPAVNTILVGTVNEGHLTENVGLADRGPLADEVLERAGRIFGAQFGPA